MTAAAPQVPLSTSGRYIVDARGRRIRLAGVNWYGAHEDDGVVSGLEHTGRRALAARFFIAWQQMAARYQANPLVAGLDIMNEPRRARVGWRVLADWLTEHDVDWCWWPLNPTQPRGTVPVTGQHRSRWGDPEPWGLLAPDWRGVANPGVLDILKQMIPPRTGPPRTGPGVT